MSDTRRMLAEMVDPLFAELGPAATIERDGNRLDELGLPALLVPEADGGFGGSWMDALTVFRLAGYTALGIDLPNAIIARVAGRESDQWFGLMAFARVAQIAGALDAEGLLFLTDVPGVLDRTGRLVKQLSAAEARALIADGTVSGGMIPKVETCIAALEAGVAGVVIVNGRTPHAVLLELFTDHGAGTLITP